MKKILINDFFDFLEKLEKTKNGEIKIPKLETVIRNVLGLDKPGEGLSIYLIPNNTERVLMLFSSPTPELFEFIDTPSPFIISYISVSHINRLFVYTRQVFLLSEDDVIDNKIIKGYLIKNQNGSFLSSLLYWMPCKINEAHVHSEEDFEHVKRGFVAAHEFSESVDENLWFAPTKVIPAQWSKEKGTEITGKPKAW